MREPTRSSTATKLFAASSAVSLTGNSVAAVALPLAQLAITGDALAAGIVAIACAVPQVLAGLFGGALLDRFNRRNISAISDVISAAAIAALPLVDMTFGLSLGWFVLLGIIGAIGDIPGMTARDTLLPSIVKHDDGDLQSFMGVYGAIQSLAVIIGPALAALALGALGPVNSLWITAGMSLAAAALTLLIPCSVGKVTKTSATEDHGTPGAAASASPAPADAAAAANVAAAAAAPGAPAFARGILGTGFAATAEGLRILFASSPVLRFATAGLLAVVMVIGALQGIVLPAFYTETGSANLLGYVLSALSAGTLVGSVVYAQFAHSLSNRRWYLVSLIGMAAGTALMCALPSYPLMLAGSAALGFFSGPISALLGYLAYEIIPDKKRGATMGVQNSLILMVSPAAIFVTAALISAFGVHAAALTLAGAWLALTAYALIAKSMRSINDADVPDNSIL